VSNRRPLTVTEAAAHVGVSVQRIRWLIRNGKLKATQLSFGAYLIDRGDLAKVTFHGKAGRPPKAG
jgi:excisionase family DNA binding protein